MHTSTCLKISLVIVLILFHLSSHSQEPDSVELDLARLDDVDFYKNYSILHGDSISTEDILVTKKIWSNQHVRNIDMQLRQQGVRTFTMIIERPSNKNQFYVIGHYQLPTPDHLARMSYYRINVLTSEIEFQDLDDFIRGEWKKVNED